MFFTRHDLENLDEKRLLEFLKNRFNERSQLDYKEHLIEGGKSDLSPKEKKEFLKDVTGFANANGGNLIIGAKEPSVHLSIDDQLVGIKNAQELARTLEALIRGNIDPRIYGAIVQLVPLSNGRGAIVVHVPPSQGRPHMVNIDKHRSFYIRHSESTDPMTTHEIKESVLLAASAEGNAKSYLLEQERAIAELLENQGPYLLFQAMPLIQPEQPANLLTKEIKDILIGRDRLQKYKQCTFSSDISPRPTIDGIEGREAREDTEWISEIHRNGYISCWIQNREHTIQEDGRKIHCLEYRYKNLSQSFCEICQQTISALGLDLPYVLRCTQFHANNVYLIYTTQGKYSERKRIDPRPKKVLRWPDQVRQAGESFEPIARSWFSIMHHAYGIEMFK